MEKTEAFIYLRARDSDAAVRFYHDAFGAEELFRLTEPSGRIGHLEFKIGSSTIMISDEFAEMDLMGPKPGERPPSVIHLHVDDADRVLAEAVKHGAELLREASDHFYGERSGLIRDPFGHEWLIGSSIEEVTPEEMQRRYTALFEDSSSQ